MPGIRAAILLSATITAPTLVFEPHLSSTANPSVIRDHELKRLSQLAQAGSAIFESDCLGCHGAKGSGSPLGPSLRQERFQRGNHINKEFHLALFEDSGEMAGIHQGLPAAELSFNEVEQVARYVREVSRIAARRE